MKRGRWEDHCIRHDGTTDVEEFCRDYFTSDDRRIALFTAAGFDPRSGQIPHLLAQHVEDQDATAFFIREERSDTNKELLTQAEKNLLKLRELFPNGEEWSIEIFDADDRHIVGGRRLASRFQKASSVLQDCTDVVLDLSAFSTGVIFTLTRLAWKFCQSPGRNLHIFVNYHPEYDSRLEPDSYDKATTIHGFRDPDKLDEDRDKTRLWIPYFNPKKRDAIKKIHKAIKSPQGLDICPVLPFPATNPRTADEDAVAFLEEFQDPGWHIDARHILHAAQDDPLDLYRQILAVHRAREKVFDGMQGSQTILSPAGSKILSLGFLLAALDYELPVIYVESARYQLQSDPEHLPLSDKSMKLLHLWLLGVPYPNNMH